MYENFNPKYKNLIIDKQTVQLTGTERGIIDLVWRTGPAQEGGGTREVKISAPPSGGSSYQIVTQTLSVKLDQHQANQGKLVCFTEADSHPPPTHTQTHRHGASASHTLIQSNSHSAVSLSVSLFAVYVSP